MTLTGAQVEVPADADAFYERSLAEGWGDGAPLLPPTDDAIEALLAVVGPGADSALLAVDLRHLGGAAGRRAENGGAVDHLPGKFVVYAVGIVADPALVPVLTAEVAAVRAALAPWMSERDYSNFREAGVAPGRFWDDATLERLREIKQAYDPERTIRTAHELD